MKQFALRVFSLCFALALLLSLALCASAAGINLGVTVSEVENGKFTVTVPSSTDADAILAEEKPTLTVDCTFQSAYVMKGDAIVDSVLNSGKITFTVESSGEYRVISGTAPTLYTVTFDVQGKGTAPTAQTIPHGGTLTKPEDPISTGLVFDGWFTDAACTREYPFGNASVSESITLYAKWTTATYTVTFHTAQGTAPTAQTIDHGAKATKPADLTADGYIFGGWYTDEACTEDNAWDFTSDTVTTNIDLYAKWTATYSVAFNANGHGTAPTAQTIPDGGTVQKPTDLTETGFVFGGWYTDEACTEANKWNFATGTVSGNMTLYAKWSVANYTVTFSANNHSTAPAAQTINHGDKITKPADLTADGYTFGGWYTAASCNEADKWDFDNDTVTAPVILYAKWTPIPTGSTETGDRTWDVDDTNAGTLKPSVSGLSSIASSTNAADDVHVELEVSALSESAVPAAHKIAIESAAHGRELFFLDLTLTKSVNGAAAADIGSTNTGLLGITLEFPTSGRSYFQVYRYHGSSVDTLTETANANSERIVVGNNKITIYAKRFSTYAIGFTDGTDVPVSSVTAVTVSPSSVYVRRGNSQTFIATVSGIEGYNPAVTWSVSGNNSKYTTIDSSGKLTVASGETARTLTVKAASVQDTTKSGTATVTVSKVTSNANTGDQFSPMPWVAIMLLCAVGIAAALFFRKKKK